MRIIQVTLAALALSLLSLAGSPAQGPQAEVLVFRGKPLPEWIEALKHAKPEIRIEAAKTLAVIGPEAKAAISALQALVRMTTATSAKLPSPPWWKSHPEH